MDNNPHPTQSSWQDRLKVLGGILAAIAGLFAVVQLITQQPVTALVVAIIGAMLLSAYFISQRHILETGLAWLAAIVIGLAIYVLIPRSGTVSGVVFDHVNIPLQSETVILNDANGVERRVKTGADGRYEFKNVPVGHFELTVAETRTGGEIRSPLAPRLDIDLHLLPTVVSYQTTPAPVPSPTNTPEPTVTHTIEPTQTATLTPTGTHTSTPAPCPLQEIFPQASACDNFFVYKNQGGTLDVEFLSTGPCVHSGSYGLGLTYSNTGLANGGWGVAWLDSADGYFDATSYSQLMFWLKGETGNETFQVGIKDISGREVKVESDILTVSSTRWSPVTINLSDYTDKVSLSSLENINLGFNDTHGSGSICIDDIEFIP